MNGHEHLYERGVVNGIQYMTAGPAGGFWGAQLPGHVNDHGCDGTVKDGTRTLTTCEARRRAGGAGGAGAQIRCKTLQEENRLFALFDSEKPIDEFQVLREAASACR